MHPSTTITDQWTFIRSDGEMAGLTKAMDWERHPLGPPATWPASLKIVLGLSFSSRFPMLVFWGSELYCFYNDAFRPSLGNDGKHPSILGQPARTAWPEMWPVIEPLIDQVMSGKGATWSEDQLIPIYRNGQVEDVYWTFGHSPVFDDEGLIGGVCVTCTETTEKVQALQELRESDQQLKMMIQQAPVAVAIMKGPDHVVEIANDLALEMWGRTSEQVLGIPIIKGMPELAGQGFAQILNDVYGTGTPFVANERQVELLRGGILAPTYINFVYEALKEADGRISGIMAVGTDVTAQVKARHYAEEGEARFRLLADSMPQFVWTSDANGVLTYFNASVYAFSGLSKEQVEREGWIQIVHPEDRDANVKGWVQAIESGQDFHFENRFRRHDGEYRWQLSRALPLRNAEGQITMWVGTSTDIQELKQQEKEKDYFISMVSHELRTPLSTLKGYVQMLQSDYGNGSDAFLVEALKVMDRQVTSLTGIISDLLDLSRMQTGVLELALETLDTDQVISQVIEEMHYSHPSHTISFRSDGPAVVSVDRNRITQVLQNYLTNAVKYAPDSFAIQIDSQLLVDQVKITVTDHGIGIHKPDMARLFQRFYRVEGYSQRTFSGFGIGLHIVADIVRRHGGTVGVESEPGKGSSFIFTLPLGGEPNSA